MTVTSGPSKLSVFLSCCLDIVVSENHPSTFLGFKDVTLKGCLRVYFLTCSHFHDVCRGCIVSANKGFSVLYGNGSINVGLVRKACGVLQDIMTNVDSNLR